MVHGKVSQTKTCGRNRLLKTKKAFPFHHLPTDVIRGILSQLPFKEAARTSVVSRDWRWLWTCYPKLVLTRETMLGSSNAFVDNNPTSDESTTFIWRVNSIIRQLSLSSATLDKFMIKFPLLGRDTDHIDRWVSLSVASRARRIILDLCPEATTGRDEIRYSLPLHLFGGSSSCVKSICLGFVSLKLPPPPGPNAAFTNLKKLGLHMVSITGDIQCLLPECDVLEWLSLTQCSLHPYLIIHQPLLRLRYLRVLHCGLHRLEVQAPNIAEFEFTNYPTSFALGDCHGMSVAHVGLLSAEYSFGYACTELPIALPHVQDRLSISLNIRTEAQMLVRGGISTFACLRHLVLTVGIQGCSKTGAGVLQLACLLELAPVLQELDIHMYYRETPFYKCDLDETSAQDLYKHLKVVYMTGFYAIRGQLELARHILRSAPALERMIIDPHVKIPKGRSPREFPELHYPNLGRGFAKTSLRPHEFPGTVITVL